MSNAIARVYALQQRELNEKERQRQQQIAKRQRLIAAFTSSGFIDIYNEFRAVPIRTEVRQRVYKSTIGELTYSESTPTSQWHTVSFVSINGCSSGPRWWCEESDTGRMRYGYGSGRSGDHGTFFDTPQGPWLDMFIEYLASAADPAVVEQKLSNSASQPATQTRRQLQPV